MAVRICVAETGNYFREIAAHYGHDADVFLLNPTWTAVQRADAERLIDRFEKASKGCSGSGKIFIASGGSGGKLRFVAHTRESLENSARALIRHLGIGENSVLNCYACLPPWHISGLMTFVRSRVSGGCLHVAENAGFHDTSALENFRKTADAYWTVSLVPTQLKRILDLDDGVKWLKNFNFILLGGAAVSADLICRAQAAELNFGVGYGMTETASLVSLWRSGDCDTIAGTSLPHAQISLTEADSRICIAATSLGETLAEDGTLIPNPNRVFETNDEGRFDAAGRLQVLGRADRYINSGGEKIDPKLVESALREVGAGEVMVVGEADAEWGERVLALIVPPFPPDIRQRLRERLPAWMLPKRIVAAQALPLDAKGKLDRIALEKFKSLGEI